MKKVFSWRKFVRSVAGDFNKFSDFMDYLNNNYDEIKHLVKKDSDYVYDYEDGVFYNEDYFNVVEDTNDTPVNDTPVATPVSNTNDKNERLKAILDMMKDLI